MEKKQSIKRITMILLRCISKGSYHLTEGNHYVAEPCLDSPSEIFPGKQRLVRQLYFKRSKEISK
jgi:hypothetical protein